MINMVALKRGRFVQVQFSVAKINPSSLRQLKPWSSQTSWGEGQPGCWGGHHPGRW